MNAITFLQAFHEQGPWVLNAISPNGGGPTVATFGPATIGEAQKWIADRDGKLNLYFCVNPPRDGASKKTAQVDIETVWWLHVDIDPRAGEPLAEEIERIRSLLTTNRPPDVPEPTFIVFSGGGYQAFWRLTEPIQINGDLAAAGDAARYNKRLEIVFGADSCHNIDRIMRLPDTWNLPNEKKRKRGRERVLAEVYDYKAENVYPLTDFTPVPALEVVTDTPSGAIEELARWSVPERVVTIVREGHDPDQPKEVDNSRSVWLFDVCCQLVRHGVPDDVIVAVITNSAYKISESVLEKGNNAARYAKRQVRQATKAVSKEPPFLSGGTPLISARQFLRRRRPTLMHYNDDWLAFDGVAYAELEDGTVKSEVYDFLAGAIEKDKPFHPTKTKVANVIDALEGAAHRPRDIYVPPCWLEGDGPSPLEIVACQNGLLHLPSGELLPPTPRFFTRNALAFDHTPKAPEPARWFAFLEQLWPGETDVVATLGEVFGYVLIPDTQQQKIFMLVGPPRSGKGTIARVLTELVGVNNSCAPTLKGIGGEFGLQPLIGKQLAIVSDLRLGAKTDHAAVAENLLRISGEDMVTANRKYKKAWSGRLAVRFLIMTNEMPRFADASGALANRFVPLMMRRSFLGKEDPSLIHKLLPELPGVLNWAVEGWRRLRERGHFELPETSRAAVQQLVDLASPVAAFIRDECELEPTAIVPKQELYREYERWCEEQGVNFPGTLEVFSTRLYAAANGAVDATRAREGDRRVPSYRGIRLRGEPQREMPF
jgi:P4 family phage/plasmid primase-like protien